MFGQLAEEFNSDLASVVQFTGVSILVLGFSNFLWYVLNAPTHHISVSNQRAIDRMPLSAAFGRRPVLLGTTFVSLVSTIWKAEAKTYSSFMGACVLNGIGAGPGEVC